MVPFEMKRLSCPSCGAPIRVDFSCYVYVCPYCGTNLKIDSDLPQRLVNAVKAIYYKKLAEEGMPKAPRSVEIIITADSIPRKVYGSGRLGQLHRDYDELDACWKAKPPLRPDYKAPPKTSWKAALITAITCVGLAVLAILSAAQII